MLIFGVMNIENKQQNMQCDTVLFGNLKCSSCKNKNTATVSNGWSLTRCRTEPQKEFYEIEADGSCNYEQSSRTMKKCGTCALRDRASKLTSIDVRWVCGIDEKKTTIHQDGCKYHSGGNLYKEGYKLYKERVLAN